jgi:hypothetical protein
MKTPLILAFLLSSSLAFAQKKDAKSAEINLVGTYRLKMVDNIMADSSRIHLYGDNPKGILMFDAAGNYAMEIYSGGGRPPFAANDKGKGTDEEYRAAVRGSNAHFGKYSIDAVNTNHRLAILLPPPIPTGKTRSAKAVLSLMENIELYCGDANHG